MSSGSKKRTQIYYPFLSKSPGKRIPSRFPNGAPMERDIRLQGNFTYLLIYHFISKALRKEHPSMFPRSGAHMETDVHSRALLNISFGVPSKGVLPPRPPHGVPSERDAPFLEPSFIHHSKSPVYEPPLLIPGSPRTYRGPYGERCPYPEPFLTYLPGCPVKKVPPEAPSTEPL
jgi:hypothetical protein